MDFAPVFTGVPLSSLLFGIFLPGAGTVFVLQGFRVDCIPVAQVPSLA